MPPSRTPDKRSDEEQQDRRLLKEIARAFVVKSAVEASYWLLPAVTSVVAGLVGLVLGAPAAAVAGAVGLGVGLCVLPATWAIRRGVHRMGGRYRAAVADRARLAAEVAELKSSNLSLKATAERFSADLEQDRRLDVLFTDLLDDPLLNDHRLLESPESLREVERWLEGSVKRLLRVAFPGNEELGLAVVRFEAGRFDFLLRTAGVPEPLVQLAPVEAHRPLPDCIKKHAPEAETWSFAANGAWHWLVVFPEKPLEHPRRNAIISVIRSSLQAVLSQQRQAS